MPTTQQSSLFFCLHIEVEQTPLCNSKQLDEVKGRIRQDLDKSLRVAGDRYVYAYELHSPRWGDAKKGCRAFGLHRRASGKDGEVVQRRLFGRDLGEQSEEQVRQSITEVPDNTLLWRLILNPDPVLESPDKTLDLRHLTRDAVKWLEERLGTKDNPRDVPPA
jgi:hypothetical protein